MNRLKGMRVYLSGNCENADKAGADWRKEVTPKLKKLGLVVFDPVHSPIELSFCDKEKEFEIVKELRAKSEYITLAKIMKEVVRSDLRLCDVADIVIVYLNSKKPTYGTIDEIVTACNQKKPVFVVCEQGMNQMPLWLFGRIPLEYMCDSLETVLSKLEIINSVDKDNLPGWIDKRWMFVPTLGV